MPNSPNSFPLILNVLNEMHLLECKRNQRPQQAQNAMERTTQGETQNAHDETKSNSDNLKFLMSHLCKNNKSISVDTAGTSGGLVIAWNQTKITLNDFTTTRNSMSTSFHLLGIDVHGLITNVYGTESSDQKANILDFLDWYKQEKPRKMSIIGGDFNLITTLKEKKVGRRKCGSLEEISILSPL
jgi:hypothetical protein